jgi:hypothetical protein
VVYSFGASTGQPRLQFRTEQNWADDSALSRGFMVVDNSLTDSLFNSNRVLNAETLMMMKEHIIDAYGEIAYLMGNGCSGGSIQQNTAASIFPGLLDGIQPSCDYPDSITTGLEVTDCVLLVNFYAGPEWKSLMTGLTQAQINAKKAAINGHLDHSGCHGWNNSFGFNNKPGNYARTLVIDNTTGALATLAESRNNCLLPAALVYDPVTNPNGTRCGDPDLSAAVWGTTAGIPAGSTRARQTGDNVGIQYGLKAVLAGAITPEEFVTLNEKIGGFDADSNRSAARTNADLAALDIAYRAGIVSSGANLGKLPIIDSRGFDEAPPPIGAVGIHYIWRSFAERARIDAENHGDHGNQVMWRYGTGLLPGTPAQIAAVTVKSLLTMDSMAVEPERERTEGHGQLGEDTPAGGRSEAGRGGRLLLPPRRPELHHAGVRHGGVRCRFSAGGRSRPDGEAFLAAPGRWRTARGEHPEVQAHAAQPGGLRASHVQLRAVDPAAGGVRRWRVRLERARRGPAARALAAYVRRRPGRRAAAAGAAVAPGPRPRRRPRPRS